MNDFEKQIHAMFDHIWDCDINHPIFDDTVGELMNAVIQCYNNLPSAEPHWIPVSERLPEETGEYLTTTMYGDVFCDYWQSCNFNRTEMVIAWMPMPEPWKWEGK